MAREIIKKAGCLTFYDNGTILISRVAISFPKLFRMTSMDDPKPKSYSDWRKLPETEKIKWAFGATALIPKSDTAAKKALDDLVKDLLAAKKMSKLPADKLFVRDGDDFEKHGHGEHWEVRARTTDLPRLFDPKKNRVWWDRAEANEFINGPVNLVNEDFFLGGNVVDMLIKPYAMDKGSNKRVNGGLQAVQWVSRGNPVASGRVSDDEVEDTFETHGDDDDI